jgi:esterase/lipase superfamily enzyme
MNRTRQSLFLLIISLLLVGCGGPTLVPTPNLYLDRDLDPFAEVPPAFQTNTVDFLYATDRAIKSDEGEPIKYGYDRSMSLAFGSCVVEIGQDVSWDVLVDASRAKKRDVSLPLAVRSIDEMGRFPETPAPLILEGGIPTVAPDFIAAQKEAVAALHDELRRRLALTPRKEAYVFVHGFNNTFEEAAYRIADLWHFLGREGVPICYSWPAGHPGLLRGYTHDRESGQYTNFHLKSFLTALAGCPELEKIHVIAHSRGTDVAATALKELIIVEKAREGDTRAALKIKHIVLAAADISAEVLAQRMIAEELHHGLESVTYYVQEKDLAIGTAEWLFADKKRIGQMRPEQIGERQRGRFGVLQQVNIIDSRIHTSFLGHAYFLSSPATLSDIILLLRYDRAPGAENGRPLTKLMPGFFILDDNYPQEAAPLPKGWVETTATVADSS